MKSRTVALLEAADSDLADAQDIAAIGKWR